MTSVNTEPQDWRGVDDYGREIVGFVRYAKIRGARRLMERALVEQTKSIRNGIKTEMVDELKAFRKDGR